jgi:hypothetical protein
MFNALRLKLFSRRVKQAKHSSAARRKLLLEGLEDRRLLALTTFMNDSWELVTDNGDGVVSAGDEVRDLSAGVASAIYGTDAFGQVTSGSPTGSETGSDTIHDAVDGTDTTGTLNILPGSYSPASTIQIDRAMTVLGPQAGVDPRPTAAPGLRTGPEAIIDGTGGVGGTLDTILRILASDVNVNGLEFTTATSDMIESLDPAAGTPISNVTLQYNIIHDSAGDEGIQLRHTTDPGASAVGTGAIVQYNHIYDTAGDGISLAYGSDYGLIYRNEVHHSNSLDASIYVYGSSNVEIRENLVYNSLQNDGIKMGSGTGSDADGTSDPVGGLIEDNVVHDVFNGGDGITVYMSGVTVRGNEVHHTASWHGAIFVQYFVNGVIIEDNYLHDNHNPTGIGGQAGTPGVKIGRSSDFVESVTVRNNRIVSNDWGILVDGDEDGGASTALIEGNDLTGNDVGVRIQNGALVDMGSTEDGNPNPTGLSTGSDIDGSSDGRNIFAGYTGIDGNFAIENLNVTGEPDVKAENNVFSEEDLAGIETVVYHIVDDSGLTLVDFDPFQPLVQIIDNGDPDFSTVGTWTRFPNQGYQDDIHYAAAGNGSSVASWTFTGISAGAYRVSATWFPHPNRATNSPFTIRDGATPLATVRVNQELAPNDFTDSGAEWEILGGVYQIVGDTLVVQLSNDANEFVIADAIRIERLVAPVIEVFDELDNIADNTGVVDFGATFPGVPVTRTFTVRNAGVGGLTLTAPITMPHGFALVSTFGSTSLQPSESTTFEVELIAGLEGVYSGEVAFGNNDAQRNPFNFTVQGTVVKSQILDNGDAGYSKVGAWKSWPQGYQGDFDYSASGDGSSVASWVFPVPPGKYRVSATWVPDPNRATNSPFTIRDEATALATVQVNQELAPDDFADAGAAWENIGGVYTITGTSLVVELRNNANQFVIADAIRIERLAGPEILVSTDGLQISDGTGIVDFGTTAPGSPVIRTMTVENQGGANLTLVEPIIVPSGFSLASSFASTTLLPGESTTFQIQLDAVSDGAYSGEVAFGNNDTDENPFNFSVQGTVAAPPTVQILDNGDAGFSTIGHWLTWPNQGYQADIHYAAAGDGSAIASWTFSPIVPGIYRISATWFEYVNRATDAPYTILDGAALDATVLVNQELAPDDFMEAGVGWEDLGIYEITTDIIVVQLNNNANEYVIADAIRIERIGDLP